MDEKRLAKLLDALPLGAWRYLKTTASTNDDAAHWVSAGAPDVSVVLAEEQTRGRGRLNRQWFTPPGSALAISIILRPRLAEAAHPARVTALGALAVCEMIAGVCGLQATIKWPNDVLLDGKKVCGVLNETQWLGEQPRAFVLGIGVNVLQSAVPPMNFLRYPATSLESACGNAPPRENCAAALLTALLRWREKLATDDFLAEWQARLHGRGNWVQILFDKQPSLRARIEGLEADGALRVQEDGGATRRIEFGEIGLQFD
ncbi:MAG: hypothetical protein OHK0052_17620 [Anaerolineales bacterium]